MDLGNLSPRAAAAKGAKLHLKDPATGEPLFDGKKPVTITLLGAEAEKVAEFSLALEKRRLKDPSITDEEAGAEILAEMTLGWENIGFGDEADFPFSTENAIKLYTDPRTEWVAGQVGPFSRDRRNFIQNRPSG